jgi:hypothetical protein
MSAAVDKRLRAKYFNLCDPRESLRPDDDRNVVGAVVAEARGRDWVDVLAERIELFEIAGRPACELFTGLPGSGKSTELRRLAARLGDPARANLLPVFIDAEAVVDVHGTIEVADVLMAILARAEEQVLAAEGKDPQRALDESALARFWHWLTNTEVDLRGLDASVSLDAAVPRAFRGSMGARVVADLRTRPSLRRKVRTVLADHVTTFNARLREAIVELRARAQGAGHAGLVVIFDSLEKLQGTTETWKDVLDSAEKVFSNRAADLCLPVHVLYTIPAALMLRMRVPVTFLPMLKLFDRGGQRAAGFEAARAIVRQRVPDDALGELFGKDALEPRVEQIIAWSGGYPREIVRLLQNTIAEPVLDEALFKRLLAAAGDEYRRTVLGSTYPWLARVHVDKPHQILDEEFQREMVDRLLQNNVVLGYLDDDVWFDIHPAVRTIPGVAAEVARLIAERAAKAGHHVG